MSNKKKDLEVSMGGGQPKKQSLSSLGINSLGGMVREIVRLPELEEFITPVTGLTYAQLKQNIQEEGIRDKLVFWQQDDKDIIIDGHTRYRIAEELNFSIPQNLRAYKEFDNIEQVKHWMTKNQLGRRNLTPLEEAFFRGQLYENEKKSWGGIREKGNTAERIAIECGVNEKTIKRDAQFYLGVMKISAKAPELKNQIVSGELKSIKKGTIQEFAKIDEIPDFTDVADLLQKVNVKEPAVAGDDSEKKLQQELNTMIRSFFKTKDKNLAREIEAKFKEIKKQLL